MRSTTTSIVLNEEQERAASAIEGVYVVLAGPGSGKSTVILQRDLKMMLAGIPSKDRLNLTFTHGAAQELASRAGILDAQNIFRTFHSFALELIKNERDKLPFSTCDTVIPVEFQDYELLFDLVKIYRSTNWRTMQELITGWKCSGTSPDKAIDEANGTDYFYALAYRDYEVKCREQGWLDFASLMEETVKLLETNEEVRNKYKRKYIAVDEAQDCDDLQFRLLQLLFDGNIFAVGDENQLIYEWRNARSGNLSNFARVFPDAKVLYLGTNHRSTNSLVTFLKEILPVDNGLASHMTTYNEEGKPFTIREFIDDEEEAKVILSEITDPQNTAVIARTNRQLFLFQRLCAMKGIKYNYLGKKDFFETSEVKKLLGYAKSSNVIGRQSPASDVFKDLIQQHNMFEIYSRVGSSNPMESNPIENLNSIVKISVGKGSMTQFLDYLRKLTHARRSSKALTLSTVHQSKGREYDIVYLVGVSQGKMPHKDGELNEEARIFFVGASRAARELHMSFWGSPSMYLLPYLDRCVQYGEQEEAV